ncbi:hypothetical protein JCM3770_003516 [Rhodotorula araucariae]
MQRSQLACTCARTLSVARASARTFPSTRAIHAPAAVDALQRVPKPRGAYKDPASVLAASKRGLESYADKLGDWAELFGKSGAQLRDAGMSVQESRYTLWLLEKYRCVPIPLSHRTRSSQLR